jgi:hypothetical protein
VLLLISADFRNQPEAWVVKGPEGEINITM